MRTPTNLCAITLSALVLSIGGCGGDPEVVAGLELRIDLPAITGSAAHAFVQVRPETGGDFDATFVGEEPLASVPLTSSRIEDAISVVTADAATEAKVRIRFCANAGCLGETDTPAQRFIIRRPFYANERTFYRIFAEDPGVDVPDPVEVDRCQIRGCVDSDLSSYCDATGTHFCELPHSPGPTPDPISPRVVEI